MREFELREKMYPNSWKRIKRDISSEKISHAFLFCGPVYTGKNEMALDFVSILNGIDLEKERKKIMNGGFPDIVIIEPDKEKKKKEIGVDQIKNAIKKTSYYAFQKAYKIIIVLGADLMNKSAGNCLLKTLEEPTEKTVLILVADREDRVLKTIRSRCQRIYFGLKTDEEIRDFIQRNERIDLPEGQLNQVVEFSHGRYRLAEELAISPDLLERKKEITERFRKALKGGIIETFNFIEQEEKRGKINYEVLEDWLYFLHNFIKKNLKEKNSKQIIGKVFEMEEKLLEVKYKTETSNVGLRVLLENYFVQII